MRSSRNGSPMGGVDHRASMPNVTMGRAPQKTGGGGKAFIAVLLILAAAFVFASITAGEWLNDNVITPVIAFFGGDQPASAAMANTPPSSSNTPEPTQRQNESIQVAGETYYLLQGGIFTDITNAAKSSAELKAAGGGGYIVDDGEKKRVILCAYLSDTDAKKIRDRLKDESGLETYVYAAEIPEFSVGVGATPAQISVMKDAFALPKFAIEKLVKITEGYDKIEPVGDTVLELKDKARKVKEAVVSTISPDDKNQSLLEVLNFTTSLCDKIEKLPENLSEKTLEMSSQLKYNTVEVIDSYRQFIVRL